MITKRSSLTGNTIVNSHRPFKFCYIPFPVWWIHFHLMWTREHARSDSSMWSVNAMWRMLHCTSFTPPSLLCTHLIIVSCTRVRVESLSTSTSTRQCAPVTVTCNRIRQDRWIHALHRITLYHTARCGKESTVRNHSVYLTCVRETQRHSCRLQTRIPLLSLSLFDWSEDKDRLMSVLWGMSHLLNIMYDQWQPL